MLFPCRFTLLCPLRFYTATSLPTRPRAGLYRGSLPQGLAAYSACSLSFAAPATRANRAINGVSLCYATRFCRSSSKRWRACHLGKYDYELGQKGKFPSAGNVHWFGKNLAEIPPATFYDLLMTKSFDPVQTGGPAEHSLRAIASLAKSTHTARSRFQGMLKRKKTSNENRTPPGPSHTGGATPGPSTHPDATHDNHSPPTAEGPRPVRRLSWLTSLFRSGRLRQSRIESSIDQMDEESSSFLVFYKV